MPEAAVLHGACARYRSMSLTSGAAPMACCVKMEMRPSHSFPLPAGVVLHFVRRGCQRGGKDLVLPCSFARLPCMQLARHPVLVARAASTKPSSCSMKGSQCSQPLQSATPAMCVRSFSQRSIHDRVPTPNSSHSGSKFTLLP